MKKKLMYIVTMMILCVTVAVVFILITSNEEEGANVKEDTTYYEGAVQKDNRSGGVVDGTPKPLQTGSEAAQERAIHYSQSATIRGADQCEQWWTYRSCSSMGAGIS